MRKNIKKKKKIRCNHPEDYTKQSCTGTIICMKCMQEWKILGKGGYYWLEKVKFK